MSEKRTKRPSKAVANSVKVGTPVALFGGALAYWAAQKFGIPPELTGSVISLLGSLAASGIAYASRGGRVGESQ